MALNTGPSFGGPPVGMGGGMGRNMGGGNYGSPQPMAQPPGMVGPSAQAGGQKKKHRGLFGSIGHAFAAPFQALAKHDPLGRAIGGGVKSMAQHDPLMGAMGAGANAMLRRDPMGRAMAGGLGINTPMRNQNTGVVGPTLGAGPINTGPSFGGGPVPMGPPPPVGPSPMMNGGSEGPGGLFGRYNQIANRVPGRQMVY